MFTTKKLYEEDVDLLECSSQVLDVLHENDATVVILDQTVFKPSTSTDKKTIGIIESNDKAFEVTRVEENEGSIRHIGTFESEPFALDEDVTCVLNEEYQKESEVENN